MAQTKRKRRTKHRGTAAGTIEARGRTGRPLSPEERKKQARAQAREARLDKQPTWNSATKRAGLASVFMFLFLLADLEGQRGRGGAVRRRSRSRSTCPSGYYLEMYLWRRRQRKKEASR